VRFTLESTEWLHTNFKEGTVDVVESKQKSMKEPRDGPLTGRGQSVIKSNLDLAGQLPVGGCDVVTDIFNAVGKELAFLQLESDTVFHKDSINTLKQTKKSSNNSRPQKNVSFPFGTEDAHHASIKGWSVARPERHHRPTVFVIVRSKKRQLFLVFPSSSNLLESGDNRLCYLKR
jgi:hypothetical protein